jgi:hypothetical protein
MITGLHGDRLDARITAVRTEDLPHLHTTPTASNVTTPPS